MKLRSFRRDEKGAAAVEFALVLPILIVLIFGIVDFGRALFAYNYLTAAVREGGRFAAVQSTEPTAAGFEGAVRAQMTGYLSQLNSLALPAVPAASITVAPLASDPNAIKVTIEKYVLPPITPIPAMLGITQFEFTPSAVFRWERAAS